MNIYLWTSSLKIHHQPSGRILSAWVFWELQKQKINLLNLLLHAGNAIKDASCVSSKRSLSRHLLFLLVPSILSHEKPWLSREIQILRNPITKESPADICRIAFTEKDIDIVQPNSLDREDHKNRLQWDTETLKLFDFMFLL